MELLFDVHHDLYKFTLLLLHDGSLFAQFLAVALHLINGLLDLIETFVVTSLDLNHVVLTLVKQFSEHAESAQEEHRSKVGYMTVLLVVLFAHVNGSEVHE